MQLGYFFGQWIRSAGALGWLISGHVPAEKVTIQNVGRSYPLAASGCCDNVSVSLQ